MFNVVKYVLSDKILTISVEFQFGNKFANINLDKQIL